MTRHTPLSPGNSIEQLLAWLDPATHEHKCNIAKLIERLGDAY